MQLEQYQAPSLVQTQKSKHPHVLHFTGFRVPEPDYLPSTSGTSVSVNSFPPPPPLLFSTSSSTKEYPATWASNPYHCRLGSCSCLRLAGSVTHTNTTSSTQRTLRSHVLHFSSQLMFPFSIYHRRTVGLEGEDRTPVLAVPSSLLFTFLYMLICMCTALEGSS